ncbi:MAG: hypothetical protein KUG73_05000 [Pseudomonadales bacterium]|nr:hypothetical protein [Pseudomonadales bacterium]
MSTEIIIALGALGIGVVLGLIWYGHNKEKERAKKAILTANLSERAHRLQRLLDTLPPAYVEKDVKLLLLNQIQARLEKLVDIAPNNVKFKKSYDGVSAQISETQSSTAKPPSPQLKTPEEAKETQKLLQDLTKVIESLAANKSVPLPTAKKYLINIHKQYIEANINYSIQVADQSRRDNKTKLAIHQYQKVLTELSKNNQHGAYSDRLAQVKETLNSLTGEGESEDETSDALSAGMDELAQDNESWKKKYF